jgi:hypothetical protein
VVSAGDPAVILAGVILGLHGMSDLATAKAVDAALLGVPPQTDGSYYVGVEAGGQLLADPAASTRGRPAHHQRPVDPERTWLQGKQVDPEPVPHIEHRPLMPEQLPAMPLVRGNRWPAVSCS